MQIPIKNAKITAMNKIVLFGRVVLGFFREADMVLFALGLVSSIYGIVLISTIPAGALVVNVQIGALVLGVLLYILFSYVDIDIIADKSWLLFIFSLLLILMLIPFGEGDAINRRAWIRFGGIGIQPAEISKVPFIIIMGRMMATFKETRKLDSFFSLLKVGVIFGIMLAFVVGISEDIGTGLVYLGIFVVMLYIAGLKLRWFAIGAAAVAAASPLIWNMFTVRQQIRIMAPWFPEVVDPTGADVWWQVHQSQRAISAGGWFGRGLGYGRFTQAGLIPEQHTDFVFSAAAEELGFVGAMAIIALLLVIIIRCIRIGIKSNNSLGMLVCTGVAAMFIVQTIMNLGMVIGFLPVIGVPLPFFSYGGSSIVTYFAAIGLVSGIKMRPKPTRFRHL